MKVGGDFVKMNGGSAEKNETKDVDTIAALLKKCMFSAGVFQTAGCLKAFEELKAKGGVYLRTERSVLRRGSCV